MLESWRSAFREPGFRPRLYISLPALVALLIALSAFLGWVEDRQGVVLPDPVLEALTPMDLTWPIFIGIYAGLALTIWWAAEHPWRWLAGIQAYALFLVLRGLCMWVAPFDPPPGMIPLVDPVVSSAAGGRTLTRDLFFSGHTATGCLLALIAPRRWQRIVLSAVTVFVAVAVVWQHVHYTIDVLVAPFAAFACYRAALWITPKARLPRLK